MMQTQSGFEVLVLRLLRGEVLSPASRLSSHPQLSVAETPEQRIMLQRFYDRSQGTVSLANWLRYEREERICNDILEGQLDQVKGVLSPEQIELHKKLFGDPTSSWLETRVLMREHCAKVTP